MKKQERRWKLEMVAPHSYVLRWKIDFASDPFGALLISDEHWDNKHCDLKTLAADHKEAVARDWPILKFGDGLCLMQGKWDKRADPNQLRKEHQGNNYLDRIIETAGTWYAPYAENIALITPGNHEQSILKRHQTNMTERLAERLRAAGSPVMVAPYWGFLRMVVYLRTLRLSQTLFWHHGYGGGGEVTRGLIDNNRTRGQYIADVFISGHIHRRNMDENIIVQLNPGSHRVERRTQLFLRSSTYKNELAEDHEDDASWHAEGGRAGRPIGGWWWTPKVRRVKKAKKETMWMEPDAQRT